MTSVLDWVNGAYRVAHVQGLLTFEEFEWAKANAERITPIIMQVADTVKDVALAVKCCVAASEAGVL